MEGSCKDCYFAAEGKHLALGYVMCCRNAPRPGDNIDITGWPAVRENWCCGDHVPEDSMKTVCDLDDEYVKKKLLERLLTPDQMKTIREAKSVERQAEANSRQAVSKPQSTG